MLLEVTNGKNVLIHNAITLAEEADNELGVAFYYAPVSKQYAGYICRTSAYQTLKDVVMGKPDEVISILVDDFLGGNYHPVFKRAIEAAGQNDPFFQKSTLDRI